ncbi:hypothetical protein EVAR_37761_1 [Eumeta japonica]|uniref:Uncharacterized protein n=1 Tax=Eumeta variegata TaxID=151549 RepID=A0A4C1WMX5_EUMVA|nr:hypothetical protein EVAR_37761_1 [Eumeta japonica]
MREKIDAIVPLRSMSRSASEARVVGSVRFVLHLSPLYSISLAQKIHESDVIRQWSAPGSCRCATASVLRFGRRAAPTRRAPRPKRSAPSPAIAPPRQAHASHMDGTAAYDLRARNERNPPLNLTMSAQKASVEKNYIKNKLEVWAGAFDKRAGARPRRRPPEGAPARKVHRAHGHDRRRNRRGVMSSAVLTGRLFAVPDQICRECRETTITK